MTIEELFESRKNDSRWNTSYPLNPADWGAYRVPGQLPFDNGQHLSFYIHIPFCKQLCTFCEYSRMLCPDEHLQRDYLLAIANDISLFKKQYSDITLLGFDIGGGTPTSLSDRNFSLLMQIYQNALSGLHQEANYEPSIEGSFGTLSRHKLDEMSNNGIHRLSLGVQSSSNSVLKHHRRGDSCEATMSLWLDEAWKRGISKVNLDFMYGLEGQDNFAIQQDLALISRLAPQQITLYELRTNMISAEKVCDKEELYAQYSQYYEGLTALGYKARFGQNTFSVDATDHGVSSYLRERMLNASSYKGFGMAAQSMSPYGLSYNVGKSHETLDSLLALDSYPEEYTYRLPKSQLAAKYMAISAYNGSFSLNRLKTFDVCDDSFYKTLDFCISSGLLEIDGATQVLVTPKGFVHYGALFSLFCTYFASKE